MGKKHYVRYLVIVLAFLVVTLSTYQVVDVRLSPGDPASAFSTLTNLYVSSAPALSGFLIVGALGLMVLIVVESRKGV